MRRLGELHDVVDAGREVALGREHLDAGVEELAHRALPAGPQLPGRGGGVRAPGRAGGAGGSRRARGLPPVPFARGTARGYVDPTPVSPFRPLGLTRPGPRRYALTPMSGADAAIGRRLFRKGRA